MDSLTTAKLPDPERPQEPWIIRILCIAALVVFYIGMALILV